MSQVHQRRFQELFVQMEALLASKTSTYDQEFGEHVEDIDGNALLEWLVKTRNLLSRACGSESEHYKEFLKNQETGTWGSSLGPHRGWVNPLAFRRSLQEAWGTVGR